MLSVNIRDLGAGQVTDDDAVPVAVEERLPLRVLVQHYGLAPLGPGQTGEGEPVGDSLSSSHLCNIARSASVCSPVVHNRLIASVQFIFVNRLEEHNNHNILL